VSAFNAEFQLIEFWSQSFNFCTQSI